MVLMSRLAVLSALAAASLAAMPAAAVDGAPWKVKPDFKNDEAALEISGAVCPGSDGRQTWCYAVNDEKKYIQAFGIGKARLKPDARIRVLEKAAPDGTKWGEPDLEAIAAAEGFLYAAGSHGSGRNTARADASRFFVFRLPVDPVTGAPRFTVTRDDVAEGIVRTDRLRGLIRSVDLLAPYAETALSQNGANIKGMAVTGGTAFFGFRAPAVPDGAVVLEVPLETLFGDGSGTAVAHAVDLGAGYGVRDMAPFGGGMLILSGAANGNDLASGIWWWRPGGAPRLLAVLDVPDGFKAETILVLGPEGPSGLDLLVMFDSQPNGAPMRFTVPLPG